MSASFQVEGLEVQMILHLHTYYLEPLQEAFLKLWLKLNYLLFHNFPILSPLMIVFEKVKMATCYNGKQIFKMLMTKEKFKIHLQNNISLHKF